MKHDAGKCQKCVYHEIYMTIDTHIHNKLYVCTADIESDDDGIRYIPEISEFDASGCLCFKKEKK